MSLIATTLTLLLGLFPPASTHVHLDLAFKGVYLSPREKAIAVDEVNEIWNAYGVDVRDADGEDGECADTTLTVMMARHQGPRIAADALGSIAFVGDEPQTVIAMYPETIAQFIGSLTIMGHSDYQWTPRLRDRIHGRVLGRALAHEIGHYLLHSRGHSKNGLMRAEQSIVDLASDDRSSFSLSVIELARLAADSIDGAR
ncbi:MAG TPA: hypothetical protein VH583_18795 [Vicinamibacterales bacterium]|jgi:hypothetical protein